MENPVQEFRKKLGVNQTYFAEMVSNCGDCSIGKSAVSNWEIDYRAPNRDAAIQLVALAKEHKYLLTLDQIFKYYSKIFAQVS